MPMWFSKVESAGVWLIMGVVLVVLVLMNTLLIPSTDRLALHHHRRQTAACRRPTLMLVLTLRETRRMVVFAMLPNATTTRATTGGWVECCFVACFLLAPALFLEHFVVGTVEMRHEPLFALTQHLGRFCCQQAARGPG
jgi:hypothetical protein